MKSSRLSAAAFSALAAAGLVACGSGARSSSAGTPAATTAVAATGSPAATASKAPANAVKAGSPVKIMVLSTMSAPNLAYKETGQAVAAYIAGVNAGGGINGHRVDVIPCDDKNDPNGAAACARRAVEDGVIATVGDYSLQGESIWPILTKAGIPRIGLRSLTPTDATSPLSFPVDGTVNSGYRALTRLMIKEHACSGVAVVIIDSAAARAVAATIQKATVQAGAKFAGVEFLPGSGPPADLVPVATKLVNAGATCAVLPVGGSLQAQVSSAFLQVEPNMHFGVTATGMPPDWATTLSTAARYTVTDAFLPLTSDQPGVQAFKAEMAKYAPGAPLNINAARSWVAAQAFVEVAKTIDGELTPQSLLAALHRASNVDTSGITAPIDFTTAHGSDAGTREFNTKYIEQVVVDGRVVSKGSYFDAY